MKFVGFLAVAMVAGLCVASVGAAPEYILKIENASTVSYSVAVHDLSGTHDLTLHPGITATMTLATQTPRVTVTGAGCSAAATPSIKTYVTLAIKANCKIETKAAGVSGF